MSSANSSPNLATFFVFVAFVLVGLSVLTLGYYWFVGRDPLRWNAVARTEAAQPPAGLIGADNAHHTKQLFARLIILGFVIVAFWRLAPAQSEVFARDLLSLIAEVWRVVTEMIVAFLAQYTCKC